MLLQDFSVFGLSYMLPQCPMLSSDSATEACRGSVHNFVEACLQTSGISYF